jgi:hypothetical protein
MIIGPMSVHSYGGLHKRSVRWLCEAVGMVETLAAGEPPLIGCPTSIGHVYVKHDAAYDLHHPLTGD